MAGRHKRWIHTAMRLCKRSNFPGYKMIAILVKGGKIISTGYNRSGVGFLKHAAYLYINHGQGGCQGIHAELAAVLNAKNDFDGAELYVAGITKAGKLVLSKPCDACQDMLSRHNLKAVYYHDAMGQVLTA